MAILNALVLKVNVNHSLTLLAVIG